MRDVSFWTWLNLALSLAALGYSLFTLRRVNQRLDARFASSLEGIDHPERRQQLDGAFGEATAAAVEEHRKAGRLP
jgi:hypothetical protein